MKKSSYLAILIGVLILGGIVYYLHRSSLKPTSENTSAQTQTQPVEVVVEYKKDLPFDAKSYTVTQGQRVSIKVTSDVADELHFHGYDLHTVLTASVPGTISFTANQTGRFEFELENHKIALGVIAVYPK